MVSLEATGLTKTYRAGRREIRALDGVSFRIEAGAFVALIGRSGCGKTTLFRHIAGLEQPDQGRTAYQGDPLGGDNNRPKLGMMFQEPRLLPWLSVRRNLLLALRRTGSADPEGTVTKALGQVGLTGFGRAYPDQLSGGMAQRAALARALCRQPDLLLMDEPFGALDALTRLQLQEELARIWADRPMTVLFITHDITEAIALADRVLIMDRGRLIDDKTIDLARPRQSGAPRFGRLKQDILNTVFHKTN